MSIVKNGEKLQPESYAIQVKDFIIRTHFGDFQELNIPKYQREYAWEKKQIMQLLSDLERISKSLKAQNPTEHYLGSITLSEIDKEGEVFEVIDGQQRIISLFLLAKLVYLYSGNLIHSLIKISHQNLDEQKLLTKIFEARDTNDLLKLPIFANNKQKEKKLLAQQSPLEKAIYYLNKYVSKNHQILKPENYYLNDLDTFNELLDKLHLVVINFKKLERKEIIFENLNSTGKELNAWDLTKNFFFSKCELKDVLWRENIDHFWNSKINKYDFIKETIASKRSDRKVEILRLFLNLELIKNHQMSSKQYISENEVYENIKSLFYQRIDASLENYTVQDFLNEIEDFFDAYEKLQKNPLKEERELGIYFDILLILNKSVTNTLEPFLMNIYNYYLLHSDEKEKVILLFQISQLITSWLVRRWFTGNKPSKNINKMMLGFAKLVYKLNDDTTNGLQTFIDEILGFEVDNRFPNDYEFRTGIFEVNRQDKEKIEKEISFDYLEEKNAFVGKHLGFYFFPAYAKAKTLASIVLKIFENQSEYYLQPRFEKEIDHILPQDWETDYVHLKDEDEEFSEKFATYCHTMGNLALLQTDHNKTKSNKSFSQIKSELKSLIPYDLYNVINDAEDWDLEKIKENSKYYFEHYALKAFPTYNDFENKDYQQSVLKTPKAKQENYHLNAQEERLRDALINWFKTYKKEAEVYGRRDYWEFYWTKENENGQTKIERLFRVRKRKKEETLNISINLVESWVIQRIFASLRIDSVKEKLLYIDEAPRLAEFYAKNGKTTKNKFGDGSNYSQIVSFVYKDGQEEDNFAILKQVLYRILDYKIKGRLPL